MIAAAGCGQIDKQELSYRNAYKSMWDRTVAAATGARKKADAAYAAGDIDAVVAAYKKLAAAYTDGQKDLAKHKAPVAYKKLETQTIVYLNAGEVYYSKLSTLVETTGGNYGDAQAAELKASERQLSAATAKVEAELKKMRFTLRK